MAALELADPRKESTALPDKSGERYSPYGCNAEGPKVANIDRKTTDPVTSAMACKRTFKARMRMSALGQKQTLTVPLVMSALGGEADINQAKADMAFGMSEVG